MSVTAPADIQYGYVYAMFLTAVGDGADADRNPDIVAPTAMTVKFTPKAKSFASSAPRAKIVPLAVTCTVAVDGTLRDPQGNVGVFLVTGSYAVTYVSSQFSLPAHEVTVTSAHTLEAPLDLPTVMP